MVIILWKRERGGAGERERLICTKEGLTLFDSSREIITFSGGGRNEKSTSGPMRADE